MDTRATKPTATTNKPESFESKRLMKQEEVAELYGLSTAWLERARWAGNGPRYVKFGRAVRYRLADLDEYVSRRERTSTSEVAE